MKQIIFGIFLMCNLVGFSQKKAAVKNTPTFYSIHHCIDKMTDEEYYLATTKLIGANKTKTKGIAISPIFTKVQDTIKVEQILVENFGVGKCNEKSTLIIMFDDSSKLTLESSNKFNCDGDNYFDVYYDLDYKDISTKKIKTIRYTNGYTYESFTFDLTATQKTYFINVINNYKVKEINCDK